MLFLLVLLLPFELSTADCLEHIHSPSPTSGTIKSPSFPEPFREGLDCLYNLTSSSSSVIHLTFLSFDLPPVHPKSRQCLDAYVLIIVVDRQGNEHVGERLCGSSKPRNIETMQPSLRLQFVSNKANDGHRGFNIQYEMLSEASIREPASFLEDDDMSMASLCGGTTMPGQLTGEIVSPGYPLTYPKNCTCHWLIRVEPEQRIYIRLALLHLSSTIAECNRAALTIIEGYKHGITRDRKDSSGVDTSEAKFCGSQQYYSEEGMKSYMSTGNRLIVRFVTTDKPSHIPEGTRVGFKIIWTAVDSLLGDSSPSSSQQEDCDQFVCKGGQVCVEQGHGVCATRSQLCIHSSLVCNGIPNCVEGDFSDEQHCYSREIVVVTSTGLFVVLLIIFTCICCDQWRKRRRLRQLVQERRLQNGHATSSSLMTSSDNNTNGGGKVRKFPASNNSSRLPPRPPR